MSYPDITIIISLFLIGFFGGFSHCTSMCGPFVLTQVNNRLNKIDIKQITSFKKLSGLALLPYHFGRITTYCFIGFISSLLSINLRNIIAFKGLAGVILIIAALIIFNSTIAKIKLPFRMPLLGVKMPFYLKVNFLFFNFVKEKIKKLIGFLFFNPTGFKNYFLGILLGFIPCGLLYGAIATVVSLDNKISTILAMFAFGIGTIPSLFFTACGGYWFFNGLKSNSKNYLRLFSKIIIFINVITLLIMAFGLIFNQI
jgi:hypothetical protein